MNKIEKELSKDSVQPNLWDFDIDPEQAPAALRHVLLHRPDAHPLWYFYVLSLVHLRPLGGRPANLQQADSSHEIICFAVDPKTDPDPADVNSYKVLRPLNLCFQLRGLEDGQAQSVFSKFLQLLSGGRISPDTDFIRTQTAVLQRLNEEIKRSN